VPSRPAGAASVVRTNVLAVRSWLECRQCGQQVGESRVPIRCRTCGGELIVRYPAPSVSSSSHVGSGIFRFADRLPTRDPGRAITLGEGDTPLIALQGQTCARLVVPTVRLKCESANPSGSFKDRIAALAATLMAERGIRTCVGTSSGNGGAAMAAYAARAGRMLVIFGLSDTLPQKALQITATGAHLVLLRGLGHDARATQAALDELLQRAIELGCFPFVTASRYMPEAMEGAKTIAYEIAEKAPGATAVYVPVGGGGLFAALWRGYSEIADELPNGPPRLVAVQPSGCPTISRMLRGLEPALDQRVATTLSGLQVAFLFEPEGVATALESSGGHFVEVDDAAVWAAQAVLAREEGILVEPAGAAALAGMLHDAEAGALTPDDNVVVIATGAGYKDPAALERIGGRSELTTIDPAEVSSTLEDLLETANHGI
jgi:threonine synthase